MNQIREENQINFYQIKEKIIVLNQIEHLKKLLTRQVLKNKNNFNNNEKVYFNSNGFYKFNIILILKQFFSFIKFQLY